MQTLHGHFPSLGDSKLQSFCQRGQLDDALSHICGLNILPSIHECNLLLNVAKYRNSLHQTYQVHAQLVSLGVESVCSLGENLVATLVACADLDDAFRVFLQLPNHTSFLWAVIISGLADRGDGEKALELYDLMQQKGFEPSAHTFVSLLGACGHILATEKGKEIHTNARDKGLEKNVFIVSALITMYGNFGNLVDAEDVFRSLAGNDLVSWNAMLSAYIQQGDGERALLLYYKLLESQIAPNQRTMVNAIQGICLHSKDLPVIGEKDVLPKGQELQSDALKKGFDKNAHVQTVLLSMYAKFGSIIELEHMFENSSIHEIVQWNVLLSAYVDRGCGENVLKSFRQMQNEGVCPDEMSYTIALQACCCIIERECATLEIGIALHSDSRRSRFDKESFVCSMLINMYGKCGRTAEAEQLFDTHVKHDIVSWTIMISLYVERGDGEMALQMYKKMIGEGMNPNDRTFAPVFQACVLLSEKEEALTVGRERHKVKALEIGRALYLDAREKGYHLNSFIRCNALTMYGKCGSIMEAEAVFAEVSNTSAIFINAMLSVYMENNHDRKALDLFRQVIDEGAVLDTTTLLCVLQACSRTGRWELCKHVHFIMIAGDHDHDLLLSTTLIHTYGNCARISDAQSVFDTITNPDIVSWNALLSGYVRQGNYEICMEIFEKMQFANIKPNQITFLLMLSVCCHLGNVEEGLMYFQSMDRDYEVSFDRYHYSSVEDLLIRAGNFTGVLNALSRISLECNTIAWSCLLAACSRNGNATLGRLAFDHVVSRKGVAESSRAYLLMSNIYADSKV